MSLKLLLFVLLGGKHLVDWGDNFLYLGDWSDHGVDRSDNRKSNDKGKSKWC